MVDEDYNPESEGLASGAGDETGRPRIRKAADAFRTISEVADELHVPQHVLRFWESKFPQVRPLKRGGGRRYYRPEDVALLRRVADLLYTQGYTIKGVQRLLRDSGSGLAPAVSEAAPSTQEFLIPPWPGEGAAAGRAGLETSAPGPEQPEERVESPPPVIESQPPAPPPPVRVEFPAADTETEEEVTRLRRLLGETLEALEALRRHLG